MAMGGASGWVGKAVAVSVALALTFGIAIFAELGGDPRSAVQRATVPDVANPCPELGIAESSEPRGPYPIDDAVRDASAVAEVVVESIGPARFRTDSGGPPAAKDLADASDGLMVFSPAVLRITHSYKGDADVAGYVVVRWGGATGDCPDAVYERSPEMLGLNLVPGSSGMLFAESLPERWNNPVTAHLKAVADELSADGETFVPMHPVQWFAYEGQEASSTWSGEALPIYMLRLGVEGAQHGQDVRLPSTVYDDHYVVETEERIIRESAGVLLGSVAGFSLSAYNTPNGAYAPEAEVLEGNDVVYDFQPTRIHTMTLAVDSWWYNPSGYGDAVDVLAYGCGPSDPAGLPVHSDELIYASADDLAWSLGDEVVVILSRSEWYGRSVLSASAPRVYFVEEDGGLRHGLPSAVKPRSASLEALRAVVVGAFGGAPFGADD